MNLQIAWFALFAVALYFIVSDESIAAAFYYVVRLATVYVRKQWWWTTHNPKNPIVKYLIYRRSLRLAREIQKKIEEEDK